MILMKFVVTAHFDNNRSSLLDFLSTWLTGCVITPNLLQNNAITPKPPMVPIQLCVIRPHTDQSLCLKKLLLLKLEEWFDIRQMVACKYMSMIYNL